jgi:hypothetical protein
MKVRPQGGFVFDNVGFSGRDEISDAYDRCCYVRLSGQLLVSRPRD